MSAVARASVSGLSLVSPVSSDLLTEGSLAESPISVPRIRKKGSKNPRANRSRSGCESCRSRRIKCDESKPVCKKCAEKSVACVYKKTLQFREDFEQTGRKFGREGVWSKGLAKDTVLDLILKSRFAKYAPLSNLRALQFVNFFYEDVQNLTFLERPLQANFIPVDISRSLNYDQTSVGFALRYYIDFISPIFNPTGISTSQYLLTQGVMVEQGLNIGSLIQYSQSKPHLFFFMLALGSIYLSRLDGSSRKGWLRTSKEFHAIGLLLVQGTLDRIYEGSPDVFSVDVLLSIVLLTLLEVANDCDANWVGHLRTAKTLISCTGFEYPEIGIEAELLKFCLEFLSYQESMGRTACQQSNSFFLPPEDFANIPDGSLEEVGLPVAPRDSVVTWMGCDVKLVSVISDITDLSVERFSPSMTEENYLFLADAMVARVDTMTLNIDVEEMKNDVIHHNGPVMLSDMNIEEYCFLLSSEVKRLVALIYLQGCILNFVPEDPEIITAVHHVYQLLQFIILKNDFKWCSTLLWSLFVVAAEISVLDYACDELRYLTLAMLTKIEANSLGNVNKTRNIILRIWKLRDLDNSDDSSFGALRKQKVRSKRKLGFVNDWETYVADKSYRISLA